MKTINILILSLLILSSSKCEKEGEDCHYDIVIKNNSNTDIIFAYKFITIESKCKLDGREIKTSQKIIEDSRTCWENKLSQGKLYESFILDPNNFNTSEDGFYDCDSIPYKNTILKHIVLTLDELKANNFTITYP